MKLHHFTYLLIFFANTVFAQHFNSRSGFEKRWAITHPFATLKVKRIYKQATPYYEKVKESKTTDQYENGGKLDAFRHLFFMAAFAQKIKPIKVLKLGIAHEKGNYIHYKKGINEHGELPDSLSTVMDLENNKVGIELGVKHKNIPLNELAATCLVTVLAGSTLYFKRNANGDYLTCEDNIIQLIYYKNKWSIPKCLIPTNR